MIIIICLQSDELSAQKKLRSELMNSEDVNAQLRKEYEMLRIEFEQNLAANEQTGPINREMRHLLSSLQNHNNQLKGELHRYKRKYKDANAEVPKVNKIKYKPIFTILQFYFILVKKRIGRDQT